MEPEAGEDTSSDRTADHQVEPKEAATKDGPRRMRVFQELFAGAAGLTEAIRNKCKDWVTARDPHDELYGSDLGKEEEFLEMVDEPPEDTPDWKHLAPPCRTFTKARRDDEHGRCKQLRSEGKPEGFGDPQAEEANVLADRTVAICEKQDDLGKFFSVENPEGSYLWELASFRRLAKRKGVELVTLHQCAYGGPYRKPTNLLTNAPWLKVGRKCEEAIPHSHTPLVGRVWSYKLNQEVWLTSEAAEYPTGLCEAWAEQWLAWIKEQGNPVMTEPLGMTKKGKFQNKLVREELTDRQGGQGGSKKQVREEANHNCMGGMRNPRKAIERMHKWQAWGQVARGALDEALSMSPGFLKLVGRLGAEMLPAEATAAAKVLKEGGRLAAKLIIKQMGLPSSVLDEVGPSGWRWQLMQEMGKASMDPDVDVPQWFKGATPLGINKTIPSRGVFPETEVTKAQLEAAKHLADRGDELHITCNYSSFEDNKEDSKEELARLEKEGHLEVIGPWAKVIERWPDAIGTKLATLVKAREDGTRKIRFIVDMRRSGVNALAEAGERIVLPRGSDFVKDLLDLVSTHNDQVEIFTADFQDAFLNLSISEEERGHATILKEEGIYAAYRGVPFGLATAPLLWGRAAAFIGRATQAMQLPHQHRLQIYVDDPAICVVGTIRTRTWLIARTLLLWAAMGARVALHKVSRGTTVKWIGATYSLVEGGVEVAIDKDRIQKLSTAVQAGLACKGLISGARSLAGELSWVAGIVPTVRPFVNMLWAAIYSMAHQHQAAERGKSKARIRPDGSVLASMVKLPLTWMAKFLQGEHGGLKRTRLVQDRTAEIKWILRTDASTTGCGGMLLHPGGKASRWFAVSFSSGVLKPLGIPPGEPGRMTAYELLAVLIGLRTWAPYLKGCRVQVQAQLDSESALRVIAKMASPEPVVNRLAAEVALLCEQYVLDAIEGEHWRNILNIEADALSRLDEGYQVPQRLQQVPRDEPPPVSDLFQVICSSAWAIRGDSSRACCLSR